MIGLGKLLYGALSSSMSAAMRRRRQEQEIRSMGARELSDLGIGASAIPFLFQAIEDSDGNADCAKAGNQLVCNEQRSFKTTLVLQP